MVDNGRLRKAISDFTFYAKPSNGDGSAPCTVQDINNLISKLETVLNAFVDEMDEA